MHVAGLRRSEVNCLNSQVSVANYFVGWHLWRFRVSYWWIHHASSVGHLNRKGLLRPPQLGASLCCRADDSPRKPALCNVLSGLFGEIKCSQKPSRKFLQVRKILLVDNISVCPCPLALELMLLCVNTSRALCSICELGIVKSKCIAKVFVFIPFPDFSCLHPFRYNWYWTKGYSVFSRPLVWGTTEKGSHATTRFHCFKTVFLIWLWPEVSRETTFIVSFNSLSLHKSGT